MKWRRLRQERLSSTSVRGVSDLFTSKVTNMIGISKQLLQRTTSSLFKLVERSLSTHKVYRNGTGNFVQDLAQAVTRTKKGGEPNFMVVIASNYRLDHVTGKSYVFFNARCLIKCN